MTSRTRRAGAVLGAGALLLGLVACSEDEPSAEPTASAETTDEPTESTEQSGEPTDGPGLGAGDGLARFTGQTVDWSDCGEGYECTGLQVPIDYDDLTGGTVEIAVKRLPAGDRDARVGSLLINPGGPGASGVDYLPQLVGDLGEGVTNAYDVVGFDPRGVGASDPVECVGTEELDNFLAFDPDPDDDAEAQQAADLATDFADACQDAAPELLPHLSTVDVARDLDVLRAVLGDERLSYYGASYGTFIGSVYAELFPDRVGRLVLDGAIDPSLTEYEAALQQAGGFETALRAYVDDCVSSGECALGDSTDAGVQTIADLLTELDEEPLQTGDDRELTRGLAFYGLIAPLYVADYWPVLTQALTAALDGDGSVLLALNDAYHQRVGGEYANNGSQVILAVNCLDGPVEATIDEIQASVPEFEQASPTFGEVFAWFPLACSPWPVEPASPVPDDYDAQGAEPILVVGTTRDPATPYEGAVALAEQLDSGVLLTREGDGHTGYSMGNECIDDAVDEYLVDGTVPEDGTRC